MDARYAGGGYATYGGSRPGLGQRSLGSEQQVLHSYGGIPSAFGPPEAIKATRAFFGVTEIFDEGPELAKERETIANVQAAVLEKRAGNDAAKGPLVDQHPHPKQRMRPIAVLICLVLPIAQFASVGAVLSFSVRALYPAVTWLVLVVCAGFTVACCAYAAMTWRNYWFRGDFGRQPYWYVFLALTLCLAFGLSFVLGEVNWFNNLFPYFKLQTLSQQQQVNVAQTPGRQLMDAGRVEFLQGTTLDLTKSIGFKNVDRYCAVPIKMNGASQQYYDYWAVGLNCCGDTGADYKCGEYANPQAHAGVRLMRADQADFYQLAVQQAVATYNIQTDHPLFFYWVQDTATELENLHDDAIRYYGFGVLAFAACHILITAVGTFVFVKII